MKWIMVGDDMYRICPDCMAQVWKNNGDHVCDDDDAELESKFSAALVRELIQEEEEAIRGLDYMVTRHRTRLAWLRAVQRGTIKP